MKHIQRNLTENILFALKHNPVVFLNGPRQAGKSTLVQKLSSTDYPAEYVTFDNATQMAAASVAPEAFLTKRDGALIVDEVQMVPELFRTLKMVVDELRLADKANSNGRFLLKGSANIMALPKLSDPLVGRMSVKPRYPPSSGEVFGGECTFLDNLFACKFSAFQTTVLLNEAIRAATFLEISGKKSARAQ